MSLPGYPEYKNSEIGWVNRIPIHWDLASLKWVCKRYSGGTPDKNKQEYWEDGTIPWLNSGSVNDGRIFEPSAFITQEAFDNSSAKWIPAGALVMALAGQGKTKGMVAQLMFESTCNQSMAAIIPSRQVNARCLYWWLVSNYQNIRNMAGGDLRDGLNLDLLGSIPCPLPTAEEQTAIATFLDRETGKIDALIAEQEKLLTLLAEKRQATISHAVTKGLNPDVPMKDSGVEWLGEVPAHWGIVTLKSAASVQPGYAFPSNEFCDDGIPVLRIGDINTDGSVCMDGCKYMPDSYLDSHRRFLVNLGEIVMAMTGATIGKAGFFLEKTETLVNQRVCTFKTTEKMEYHFLWYLLNSRGYKEHIGLIAFGGAQPNISDAGLLSYRTTLPPLAEQQAIICFLDKETTKLDTLTSEATRAITLLKERRSALISAAVTGKIDVRNLVAAEVAA